MDNNFTSAASAEKVRPTPTVGGNSPVMAQKKATRIHIGARPTDYPVSAVMAGWRGDKIKSSARPLGSFDATPVESQGFRGPANV